MRYISKKEKWDLEVPYFQTTPPVPTSHRSTVAANPVISLFLFVQSSTYLYPPTPATQGGVCKGKRVNIRKYIRRPRPTARGSASGQRGCEHNHNHNDNNNNNNNDNDNDNDNSSSSNSNIRGCVLSNSSSSSRRKKLLKSSFSMGFRSYVGEFFGAMFMLLRPSLPWCFPIREVCFEQQQQQQQQQGRQRQQQQQHEIIHEISFYKVSFLGIQKPRWAVFGASLKAATTNH